MILVTGGTGLVGSHLLLELLNTEENIRAIHRRNSNLEDVKKVFSYYLEPEVAGNFFERINWVEADLLNIPALERAFEGVKKVYHCAALVSFDSSMEGKLRKINIEGTANIVNLCIALRIEKLCYISSIATMDANAGEEFVTENFTWLPEKDHTEYAITKHGAEIEVWRASQEGLPVIILNPGIILGAGFWNKGSGKIFSRIDSGLKYHFPKITGFVGVKDVALAAILAMNSSAVNEQYILISENISFKEVLCEVADNLGKSRPEKELKPWMVYMGWLFQSFTSLFGADKLIRKEDYKSLFEHSYYSNEKIKRNLNFDFTPINKVIEETSDLYKRDKETTL